MDKQQIEHWKEEGEPWFVIEAIPDELLPARILKSEGGASRRRSSFSLREIVGGTRATENSNNKQSESSISTTVCLRQANEEWRSLAEEIYEVRTNNFKSNIIHANRVFNNNETTFAIIRALSEVQGDTLVHNGGPNRVPDSESGLDEGDERLGRGGLPPNWTKYGGFSEKTKDRRSGS